MKHETLDPQDWQEMRTLAHRMVDDALNYLETVRERPVWQAVPPEVAERFTSSPPLEPEGAESAYQDFLETVLPYPIGNIHPRFWGWYMGSGTVIGALGEFLAAVMNANLGGGEHAPMLVERQVLDWCKTLLGFPETSSGLLTSGASVANLIGLAVARNAGAGYDVRSEGVGSAPEPLVFYASSEVHSCHQKAAELMGLGSRALRKLPVNERYELELDALREAVAEDQAKGRRPFCVVGTAGTVNTGAVDDLNAIADLCREEGLWFHVDGAIGALLTLSPEHRSEVAGLERADSVALDLHKWMHAPIEVGVALVRNERLHRETFSLTPAYLQRQARGLAGGEVWFSDYGLQRSRSFRALKVWLSFKTHGLAVYGRLMEQNIRQAHALARRIDEEAKLERLAPVGMDIVCFRYNPGTLEDAELNRLNQELLVRIHESGVAAPSYTTLQGRYCLRVAIANHRSRDEDFELFLETLLRLGDELVEEGLERR